MFNHIYIEIRTKINMYKFYFFLYFHKHLFYMDKLRKKILIETYNKKTKTWELVIYPGDFVNFGQNQKYRIYKEKSFKKEFKL